MLHWLTTIIHKLQIKLLQILNPVALFHKLNKLSWYKATLQQWVDTQKFMANSKILEVACATGLLSENLARNGFKVTGVDASTAMLDVATAIQHRADYKIADVLNLPFENNTFDVVISASLINIISDKKKAITEMIRVCKPGGVISLLVPTQGFSDKQLAELATSLAASGFSLAALNCWHQSAAKMSKQDIDALLLQQPLRSITTHYYLHGMLFSITARKIH
ncbi:class I SAM-dependent methyltransferase [Beggiatoa alba]|nr:class I SAM-dependent methyltransferase [Beggiatoa alba]